MFAENLIILAELVWDLKSVIQWNHPIASQIGQSRVNFKNQIKYDFKIDVSAFYRS